MSRSTLTVPAPAKLNLFLHVTGRRPDGYHAIESLMVMLDFGDTLTLERRDDEAIVLTRPLPGVPLESDLVYRAARLLKEHCASKTGVTIGLDKRIPMGAGLGGGSSDAAAVMLALNRLWDLRISRGELMRLALELGADVPFFIFGRSAHVTGIGDVLREVTMPRSAFLILVPPVHIGTAGIFAAEDLPRNTPTSDAQAFANGVGHNDLQAVAVARHPAVATALRALDGADFEKIGRTPQGPARMSGSGSAVFITVDRGLPETETGWRAAGNRYRDEWKFIQRILYHAPKLHDVQGKAIHGSRLISARGIPSHPLREFAAK